MVSQTNEAALENEIERSLINDAHYPRRPPSTYVMTSPHIGARHRPCALVARGFLFPGVRARMPTFPPGNRTY